MSFEGTARQLLLAANTIPRTKAERLQNAALVTGETTFGSDPALRDE